MTHVVTLANSIVGVSVLAMPFCFKFCGVFLATLMLVLNAIITRIVCYFLLKAGIMTKRRTYELLAYHTFGIGGKFLVEITMIGFLFGTLIAFLVVIGDLGPQIVAEIFNVENNDSLRTIVMTGLALFVALPLGFLRDIDSLGSVSTISFLFYFFLVVKILNEGFTSLGSHEVENLNFWRPAGMFQTMPIFSMALSCQTQIFAIYDSLPEPSLHKMNDVVKKAVYLCTIFYFFVGFFGYVAFSAEGFTGNILLSFGPTWTTQLIKVCFVLSIAFSVPLCVFPCRASLFSLLFRANSTYQGLHDTTSNYIPDGKLRILTVLIIATTLVIALLIPNIELVLGLVGSTAGTVICLIFPSAMFIRVTSKQTTERLLAQFILALGICTMVVTTYAILNAVEQTNTNTIDHVQRIQKPNTADLSDPIHSADFSKIIEAGKEGFHSGKDEIPQTEPKLPVVKQKISIPSERPLTNYAPVSKKIPDHDSKVVEALIEKPITKEIPAPVQKETPQQEINKDKNQPLQVKESEAPENINDVKSKNEQGLKKEPVVAKTSVSGDGAVPALISPEPVIGQKPPEVEKTEVDVGDKKEPDIEPPINKEVLKKEVIDKTQEGVAQDAEMKAL